MADSRANNARAGITGMRLFKQGDVLPVLEGDDDAVEALFAKITRDPRHHGVLPLLRKTIDAREFGEWEMSFRDLDAADLADTPGSSDFTNASPRPDTFGADPDWSRELLLVFRASM